MGRPAFNARQILTVAGGAGVTALDARREWIRRPVATGALVATLQIQVQNNNGGGVARDADPWLIVRQIRASLNLNNGQAPVCTIHPMHMLQAQAVADQWLPAQSVENWQELVNVADGAIELIDLPMILPLANLRSPGINPDGEVYGEHIADFVFESANLMNGQHADFAVVNWTFTVASLERATTPFLGAARMFRQSGITDSVQGWSYGFVEDLMLFGTLNTIAAQQISIRRGNTTIVENAPAGGQARAAAISVDPDYQVAPDTLAVAPVFRGYRERLTRIPMGRLEIVDYSGNWPAGTIAHVSMIQPVGLAVPGFLYKWQGTTPIIEGETGAMDLGTARAKFGAYVNFVPLRVKARI